MTVEAIQGNQRHHNSALRTIGQGVLIGSAAGLAAKYTLPLTAEEKKSDEYVKIINKINEQKSEYTFRTKRYLNSLQAKDSRTTAEDKFIKMFDGMKEGEHVKKSTIRKAIKELEAENPLDAVEFKKICKETSKIAEKTAKQCISAYKLVTKHIRPTGFFAATGAVVGTVIAVINDILKTNIKN